MWCRIAQKTRWWSPRFCHHPLQQWHVVSHERQQLQRRFTDLPCRRAKAVYYSGYAHILSNLIDSYDKHLVIGNINTTFDWLIAFFKFIILSESRLECVI
jgi:hypothetical protein